MGKLLVVGGGLVGQVTAEIMRTHFEEVIEADHASALEKFLTEEPTHVLVFDYDKHGDGKEAVSRGLNTWRDIKNSAESGQVIVRSGFSSYDSSDYIQMPFHLEVLRKALGV